MWWPTLWLTDAWADNRANNVDFIAQEIIRVGITVKLEHRGIIPALLRVLETLKPPKKEVAPKRKAS